MTQGKLIDGEGAKHKRVKKHPAIRFQIIYAAPPWVGANANDSYRPMTYGELCALRPFVAKMADKNCLLLMWATPERFSDAVDLGRVYGFEYVDIPFMWLKTKELQDQLVMHPTMVQVFLAGMVSGDVCKSVEACLMFRKGLPRKLELGPEDHFILAPPSDTGDRPNLTRVHIDRVASDAMKIELFARSRHVGWTAWGDQIGWMKPALDDNTTEAESAKKT